MIDHEAIAPIVQTNAGVVRRLYPITERGDLEGVQWEWIYSNPDKVNNYLRAESLGLLSNRLRTVAMRYAQRENEVANGRSPEDFQAYTPRVVGELLKDVFSYQDWQSASQVGDGMPTAKRLVNTSGDRMAMLSDVGAALKQLPVEQYNVIVWTYKYGYPSAKLADTLGINDNAARMRVSRAIKRLSQILSGMAPSTSEGADPEYTGARKAMSNAQSRAVTASQWE